MGWQKNRKVLLIIMAAVFVMLIPFAGAAAQINDVSKSTSVNGDAINLTINRPADVREGDLLLAQITYEKGTDARPITAPTGWKNIITTDADKGGGYKDIGQALYWKVAGKNEPQSYTWRFSQKVKALGGIINYRGVDRNNPIAASSGRGGYGDSTGKNQLNAPSLYAAAGTKLVGFYGFKESANLDTPSGMSRIYQERDDDNDYTVLAADEAVTKSGNTGERVSYSWEYDDYRESVESKWVAQLVVLRGGSSSSTPPTQGSKNDIKVYIDNKLLSLEDKPFIQSGRTLVPMRGFFEALGAEVHWDAASRTAVGIRGGVTVKIAIGSTKPTVNGVTKTIDVPARIYSGRTYIPLRFVGEALGDSVVWNGSTQSIHITRK